MSTDTLIRAALDAGVALKFVGGKLKACGHVDVLRAWAPRLRENKAALIEALTAPPEQHATTDWKPLAALYHAHHFNCPTCIAAGRGYGLCCGTGTALWAAYSEAVTDKRKEK